MRAKDFENGISGNEWTSRHVQHAIREFSLHHMTVIAPGHWYLRGKNSCFSWCDILTIRNKAITVWGDIDTCTFAYASGRCPEALVRWIGNSSVGVYGREKATLGMGSDKLVNSYIPEVAIYDLKQRLEEEKEYHDEEEWDEIKVKYCEIINETIEDIRLEYEPLEYILWHKLHEEISEFDQDAGEWISDVGKVTSQRVIYAMIAIRRLAELLGVRDEREE